MDMRPLYGRRVLVVEDEYFLAEDVAEALRRRGADIVGPISSVAKALPLVARPPGVDIAVLDIDVDGTSVMPVAKALASRGIPFVFATAFDPATIPDEYGNVPCWQKPFEPDELARSLPDLRPRSARLAKF